MSVGFFPPITISLVFPTLALKPFAKKREKKSEQIVSYYGYLKIVFSNFFVTKCMGITVNISCYVRIMYAPCVL